MRSDRRPQRHLGNRHPGPGGEACRPWKATSAPSAGIKLYVIDLYRFLGSPPGPEVRGFKTPLSH